MVAILTVIHFRMGFCGTTNNHTFALKQCLKEQGDDEMMDLEEIVIHFLTVSSCLYLVSKTKAYLEYHQCYDTIANYTRPT
jgi:hypothetical protein